MPKIQLDKILLVEDDADLADLIKDYLIGKNFDVDIEDSGHNAVQRTLDGDYDLVILDLMLPGKDGITICKEIRGDFSGGILMLTASNDSVDQILGLEIGADDYVQKPVEPRILLARINSLLRRTKVNNQAADSSAQSDLLRFGNLSINRSARSIFLGDSELTLTNPEYDILTYLAENAGNIVTRDALFRHVKNFDYDGQNRFIDITISQIRKKLGDSADTYLKTVRGKGYLFRKGVE